MCICVGLTHLNKAVQCEIHPLPSTDENLAKLGDRRIFSKLDTNSRGFWQIPPDDEFKSFTTFVTPFGRFCFNRLPFGIGSTSASNVPCPRSLRACHSLCQIDVLIHRVDQPQYDGCVQAVLHRLQEAGLTLMTNVSSPGLQLHSLPTSLLHVALDSTQIHRRPLL